VGDPPAARGSAGGSRVGAYPIDHRRVAGLLVPESGPGGRRPVRRGGEAILPPGEGPPLRVADHRFQALWRPAQRRFPRADRRAANLAGAPA